MAFGVNSVMSMGVGALFASQANIQVTGNNISNVNTPGYSRQAVVQTEKASINYNPGQVGQGVQTKEIIRYFDAFVESNFLQKYGSSQRYEVQYSQLRYVDSIFNEANIDGIGSSLDEMFKAWNKLSQYPNDLSTREALLAKSQTLATSIRNTDQTLRALEEQMNSMIRQDVNTANNLMQEIAALNREISASYLEGRNNPNELMDTRDAKVRELAGIIDIHVEDRGPGAYSVSMKNGNTLVQNDIAFKLDFKGAGVENNLTASSPYKATNGTAHFAGSDHYEYTVEMVTEYTDEDGNLVTGQDTIGGGAKFKVSIDGGKTWLTNDNGDPLLFNANEENGAVRAGELDLWFDAGQVANGDRFVIAPKSDVYWVSTTSGSVNISTQIYNDGSDNSLRITGGSLGGLLEFRDYRLGEYRDRLDAVAQTVVWEVNRIHSTGAGLEPLQSVMGTYKVGNTSAALGSPDARFTWADRLQSGNMTFAVYNPETGKPTIPYPGLEVMFQQPGGGMGNFDPAVHTLQDVANAINNASFDDGTGTMVSPFSANIIDGKLHIQSSDPDKYAFGITGDTTGLAAALGLNTFFTGESASTFAVHGDLANNLNLINAGRPNGVGEINPGDARTAEDIAKLVSKAVTISTTWNKPTSQTIGDYYASLVTKVGADTAGVKFTAATETAIALDLHDRQEEISGVNLDEEMSNLIKFQASYKAAAKLITTADEMLQVLLGLKQ